MSEVRGTAIARCAALVMELSMQKPPDLIERLVDFDRCGNTATERFTLRMEAADEIKRLRRALEQIAALRKHEIMSWQYRLTEAISIAEKALGLR